MKRGFPIAATLLAVALGWSPGTASAAEPWAIASGAAFMPGYDPGPGSRFATAEGWTPFLAAERSVNHNLSWRAEATYRGSRTGRDRWAQEVHWASLGVGFGWDSRSPGVGVYLEAAPTLFGLRWIGSLTSAGSEPWLERSEFRDVWIVVPGLVTGVGLRFHGNEAVSVRCGLRLVRTSRPLDELNSLSGMGVELGVQWRSEEP